MKLLYIALNLNFKILFFYKTIYSNARFTQAKLYREKNRKQQLRARRTFVYGYKIHLRTGHS